MNKVKKKVATKKSVAKKSDESIKYAMTHCWDFEIYMDGEPFMYSDKFKNCTQKLDIIDKPDGLIDVVVTCLEPDDYYILKCLTVYKNRVKNNKSVPTAVVRLCRGGKDSPTDNPVLEYIYPILTSSMHSTVYRETADIVRTTITFGSCEPAVFDCVTGERLDK